MINIISVVFKQELSYLKTQAKSIELYATSSDINAIIVVVNDSEDVLNLIDLNWYGVNASKVKLIHFSELISTSDLAVWNHRSGWHTQQLCKLLAASIADIDWNMIIDAKTFFICPLILANVITPDNKAFSNPTPISHYFEGERDFIQQYFNIQLNNNYIGPGGVPFLMHTPTVKSMINYIKIRENSSLLEFFFKYPVTEFLLYSGYVMYILKDYSSLYSTTQRPAVRVCNIADWDVPEFDSKIRSIIIHRDTLTMSLHRRGWQLLTDEQKTKWVELLNTKGLINSVEDTKNELNTILAE